MTAYAAYCASCDIQVDVEIDEGRERVTAENVSCPALDDSCRAGTCLLARVSPAQLRDQLEFIPASGDGGSHRGLEEAARVVERARRRSLSREAERLRNWWAEVRPQ